MRQFELILVVLIVLGTAVVAVAAWAAIQAVRKHRDAPAEVSELHHLGQEFPGERPQPK